MKINLMLGTVIKGYKQGYSMSEYRVWYNDHVEEHVSGECQSFGEAKLKLIALIASEKHMTHAQINVRTDDGWKMVMALEARA